MNRFIFGLIITLTLPTAIFAASDNQATSTSTTNTSQPQAADTQQPASGAQQPASGAQQPASGAQQPASGAQQPASGAQQPASGAQQPASGAQQPASGAQQPASGAQQPASGAQQPAADASNIEPAKPQPINCKYKVGEDVDSIPSDLIKKWATKAAEQAFSLSYSSVDQSMTSLEQCFTKNGWKSFNTALKRSGNLETIKKEKLNVSPTITGDISVNQEKDNQWKVTLPMTVTYKNDKNTIDQELNISILVGRKTTGDLGIMQLIAAPAKAAAAQSANKPTSAINGNKTDTKSTSN